MGGDEMWAEVEARLLTEGWRTRAVAFERLSELEAYVGGVLAGADDMAPAFRDDLRRCIDISCPQSSMVARIVVVGAVRRPVTRAVLHRGGTQRTVVVPPHYAGYHDGAGLFRRALGVALAPFGYGAAGLRVPLKALAAWSGLGRYGRTNVIYVQGFGSYLYLVAAVSDAPPPDVAEWQPPKLLDRCRCCDACRTACPTGAIAGDRLLLHGERCLTYVNEDEAPFPGWVRPEWHACAVGCLRCQLACPENAGVGLVVAPPVELDEEETTAVLGAADAAGLSPGTRARLARCGLDYAPAPIARNLGALTALG